MKEWIQAALACGAAKAVVIPQSQIVLSAEFRDICRSGGCGCYGRCWMCPPEIGDVEELMAQVRGYPRGLLYQTIREIEDSFDIEGMFDAGREHVQVSQRLQEALGLLGQGSTLHLTCGGCRLCESCTRLTGEPCRYPDRALPSMEGYGVDVYNTTKDTPLQYINGQNTVTFFGLVLFLEA